LLAVAYRGGKAWSALRSGRSREAAFLVMDWQGALPTKGSLKYFHCTPRIPSYFIKVASSDVIQYCRIRNQIPQLLLTGYFSSPTLKHASLY
jgi:hypothetical protein